MGRFKFIAALEISSEEVRFAVSRISFTTNCFMVVHKSRLQGHWYEGDKIINKEEIIRFVKKSIDDFETKFRSNLESVNLVIPDFSSRSDKTITREELPLRRQITQSDFHKLVADTKRKFTSDYELAIKAKPIRYFVDGYELTNLNQPIMGQKLEATIYVTVARKDIIMDHSSIIDGCEKKVGIVLTTSMAQSEVMIDDNSSKINVIANWMNHKVVLSLHVNGILYSVKEWNQGIDDIASQFSKKTDGLVKQDVIKKYIYRMLEVNRELPLDENVILRRSSKSSKVELTSLEFKKSIANYLAFMIQKVDSVIDILVGSKQDFKVYHVGKISKIVRSEEILREHSKYESKLEFPKIDVFGASENWIQNIVGMMLVGVNKEISRYRAEQERLVMMQRAIQNDQARMQQQQYAQRSYISQPQPHLRQQMAPQMVQKSFIK